MGPTDASSDAPIDTIDLRIATMPSISRLSPALVSSPIAKSVTNSLPASPESLEPIEDVCRKAHDVYVSKGHKISVENRPIVFQTGGESEVASGKRVIETIADNLVPAFAHLPPAVRKEVSLQIAFAIVRDEFARIDHKAINETLENTRLQVGEPSRTGMNIQLRPEQGCAAIHRTSCWDRYSRLEIRREGATQTTQGEMADRAPVLTSDFRVCYAARTAANTKSLATGASYQVEGWVSWSHTASPVKELSDALKPKFQQLSFWERICAAVAAFFDITGIYFLATSKAQYQVVLNSRPNELNEAAPDVRAPATEMVIKLKPDAIGSEGRMAHENTRRPRTVIAEFKTVNGAPVVEDAGRAGTDPLIIPLPEQAAVPNRPPVGGGQGRIYRTAVPNLMTRKLALAGPAPHDWPTQAGDTRDPFAEPHNIKSTRPASNARSTEMPQFTPGPTFTELYRAAFSAEPVKGTPIPEIIHRFWAGGEIGQVSFNNLLDMQRRVTGTRWTHIIWTSSRVNEAMGSSELARQFRMLRDAGAKVMDVDELIKKPSLHLDSFTPSQLRPAFERRTNEAILGMTREGKLKKTHDHVKFLSDISRLLVTFRYGGVYMDTDIGPGSVDFSTTRLYHRNPDAQTPLIPLIGAQVHTLHAFEKEKQGPDAPSQNLFNKTIVRAPAFNFFYATAAKTDCNRNALSAMVQNKENSGMEAAIPHFERATELNPQDWVVSWLCQLAWATPASDLVG